MITASTHVEGCTYRKERKRRLLSCDAMAFSSLLLLLESSSNFKRK